MCWECYNCVKICPTQAVEVRGYADFVPMGAAVTPLRSTDYHHVDGQVPQRHDQALQVPHPHHPEGPGGTGRWIATKADLNEPRSVHRAGIARDCPKCSP